MSTEESTEARRFIVTDAPALAPGVCLITRTGVGPFIDTKVDLSPPGRIDRGRVYLSAEAVREMAEELGLLDTPEDQQEKLKDTYDLGYNRGYEEATKEDLGGNISRTIADLRQFIGQLTAYMVPAGPEAPEDAGPVLAAVEPAEQPAPVDPEGADESPAQPRPAKRKSAGARGGKRPDRVSADTGDGADLRI